MFLLMGQLEGIVSDRASVEGIKESWEAIKGQERKKRQLHSVLADVPTALPALSRAQKTTKKSRHIGFDWDGVDGVLDKLDEEIAEYQQARSESVERQEQELGDILFTCVNLARHNGLDAEAALRRASARFEGRFNHMEATVSGRGQDIREFDIDELNLLWSRQRGCLKCICELCMVCPLTVQGYYYAIDFVGRPRAGKALRLSLYVSTFLFPRYPPGICCAPPLRLAPRWACRPRLLWPPVNWYPTKLLLAWLKSGFKNPTV